MLLAFSNYLTASWLGTWWLGNLSPQLVWGFQDLRGRVCLTRRPLTWGRGAARQVFVELIEEILRADIY